MTALFKRLRDIAVMMTPLLVLSACVIGPSPQPNDPYFAPVMQPTPAAARPTNGSLYRDGALTLFADQKAARVGDILTVLLQENTISTKSSNVEVTKESETSIPEATLLGRGVSVLGNGLGADLSSEREFVGEADASQRNNLRGDISVTVVDIWPNGALVLRGEKWMTLNRGDEYIRFSGSVRPQDIRQDNTVLSN